MSIIMNLSRNKELIERLCNGTLAPKDFITMDPKDMATKEAKERREKAEKDAMDA